MKPSSSIRQKILASTVNCTLIVALTLPLYPLLGTEAWKLVTISSFFGYNLIYRKRCFGMRVAQTYIEPPTSFLYASLYTLGFATFFYHVFVPTDLLIANTILQVGSLTMTGNTLHANIAASGTMSRGQYLDRAKGRARLYVIEGKLHEAVSSLASDLDKWPDLRPADYLIDMGRKFAKDGNQGLVLTWIEGFE